MNIPTVWFCQSNRATGFCSILWWVSGHYCINNSLQHNIKNTSRKPFTEKTCCLHKTERLAQTSSVRTNQSRAHLGPGPQAVKGLCPVVFVVHSNGITVFRSAQTNSSMGGNKPDIDSSKQGRFENKDVMWWCVFLGSSYPCSRLEHTMEQSLHIFIVFMKEDSHPCAETSKE